MSTQYDTEVRLGQAIFGHAELGDKQRTSRLVETFNTMRRHPGGTLPDKLLQRPICGPSIGFAMARTYRTT